MLSETQQATLARFLASLADLPWFAHAGQPDETAVVARDLVEAWDGWNREMLAVWAPATHALERVAVAELSDAAVDEVFRTVSLEMDAVLGASIERYFDRRPIDSEVARLNSDRGLGPEWLDTVKRDLSWAAIEAILGRPDFFTDLRYYRAGRWPCAWENANRSGRVIVL